MRRVHAVTAFAALGIFACLFISGCGPDHIWGMHGEGGIESLNCDGRTVVVLVPNFSWESRTRGNGITSRSFLADGRWRAPDGQREIAWTCRMRGDADGTVVVDGKEFALNKGALFLVSANDNKVTVEQITVDMSKLQGASLSEELQALADDEPRLARFLEQSNAEK